MDQQTIFQNTIGTAEIPCKINFINVSGLNSAGLYQWEYCAI